LRRFNLIINYPEKEIHLSPNGHFRDPFDYSYTGMTMYNIDGVIIADDIIKGSPADRCGLKNGDVIVAINNNFSADVEVYKDLLQKTGTKIQILVMREHTPVIIFLRVGRIR
jgi:C-terminal processing protease CtpA/Prc